MSILSDKLEQEFAEFKAAKQKTNIVIAGATGAGKSSLINHIFSADLAAVGHGRPETRGLNYVTTEKFDIGFYDSEGYEITEHGESNSNFKQIVVPTLIKKLDEVSAERPHLCWYCIDVSTHRITEFDIENIKLLSDSLRLPLAVVLTKSELDELDENNEPKFHREVVKELNAHGMSELPVFDVSTQNTEDDYDVEKLLDWSVLSLSDDALKASFIAMQQRSIPLKRDAADKVIKKYSLMASAAGGVNIFPGSDAAILMPLQIKMSVEILDCFGFKESENALLTVLKAGALTSIGKYTASSLSKFIPVLGQVINAAVAGSLTYGTGVALKSLFSDAYEEFLRTGETPNIEKLLTSDLFERAATFARKHFDAEGGK